MADQYQLPPNEEPSPSGDAGSSGLPSRPDPTIPVENVQPSSPNAGRPKNDRRWLPLLLIGGGILLFLGNTGVFASVAWSVLLPLGMLAVGLDLITAGRNRRRIATAALVAAPLLVLLVGGAQLFDRVRPAPSLPGMDGSQPNSLEGIERIRVEIKQSAGNLEIHAQDADNDTFVLDGSNLAFRRDGAVGIVEVNASGRQEGNTELMLPPNLPLDMRIDVRAGNAGPIDLRDLKLESLQLKVSAGNTEVLLPDEGVMDIEVNSTAGNVEIQLPDELEARIEAEASLGKVNVDERFHERDGGWSSPDYNDSLPNRATLKLAALAGNIEVE